MKYYTENELQNFRFEGAYIAETCAVNGIFEMILDNVTILPQNSCNRDIREMRANELKLKIREPEITAFVEEGYKVYDADGNLKEKKEDILIAAEDQAAKLKELEGCEIYSIEQEKGVYTVSIVLMSIFLLCKEPLLILLQVPEETMAGAMEYLTIILIGIPFTMAYNMEAAMLQAVGNSMTPLLFLLFSSVLNISLDYVFMALLAMGIGGAAFATVLSQGVSAFLAFILIWRNYPLLHFKRNDYQVEKKFVLEMVVAGFSMALMSAIYNIGSVILQGSINALGNLYITAQVGARRLAELFHTPGLALGTSVATYTSQNMGGGNRNRIKKGVWSAFFLFAVWWIFSMVFVTFFVEDAVRLVTGSSNADVIYNTALYLRISFPLIPTMAVIIILRNMLQGMNHLMMPLVCSSLELIGKVIFAIWVVPAYGYFAVCLCEPVTWVVCCIFVLICAFLCRKELR